MSGNSAERPRGLLSKVIPQEVKRNMERSKFFESKRNSYFRRYIIIYWSIAAIVLILLAFRGKGFI